MKSYFDTELDTRELLGSKYAQYLRPFLYFSEILDCMIEIPVGFVCDYESVPFIKATSKRSGGIHDYLCRSDSIPVVTKKVAASIYLEAQTCRDALLRKQGVFYRFDRWVRRHVKTLVVRVAPGYFHKFPVSATVEDLRG